MADQSAFPKIDLTTFFFSVSSAAFMGLGEQPDLPMARQNIDLLELMQEKTRGNRTPDEDRLLEQLLFETRMRYVECNKSAPAAPQESHGPKSKASP